MNRPDYIERGGDLVPPQPFLHQGVRFHGFFLECTQARLQALVDGALPKDDPTRVEVLGDHVLLSVAVIPKITSTDPRGRQFGSASEIDVALWIPVASGRGRERSIDWYIPYLFVDNPYAMAIGRESYGFPKSLGSFSLPTTILGGDLPLFAPLGTTVSGDGGYHVDVVGISERGPDARATKFRLLSITPSGKAPSRNWRSLLSCITPLFGTSQPLPVSLETGLAQLERMVVDRSMSLLFLRQLRDVEHPEQASYQELLRAPARVVAFRGGGLLPHRHALRISPCASHPIATELGLARTDVAAAFWLDFDFVMDKGTRLTERASASTRPKKRIAILGGGMGALSTALALTERAPGQEEVEVTVYQTGWRLGGKCASSRNPRVGGRIEEHGLHLWFGCYENAFRMMRGCYAELGRPASHPMPTWRDAFHPEHGATLHQHGPGGWRPWRFDHPSNHGTPGDATREDAMALARNVVQWLRSSLDEAQQLVPLPRRITQRAARLVHVAQQAAFSIHGLKVLATLVRPQQIAMVRASLRWFLARRGEAIHRQWLMLDFGLTVLYGILRDDVMVRGFRSIDDQDLRQWLTRHGACPETLDSAPVRVLYDLVFGYEEGDLARPRLAAGTALKATFRLSFDYRGAFIWRMQAGMGETVITPIYELLLRRGVRFELFHHVKRIEPSVDGRSVGRVVLSRQATVDDGPYRPLVEIDGHGCWPEEPRYDQLVEGEALRGRNLEHEPAEIEEVDLHAGRDFDAVVLAIPVGALPEICAPLAEASPRWRDMLSALRTNATISAQVWSTEPPHECFLQGTYQGALSTCADMTHLLAAEGWTGSDVPRSLGYLCGTFADGDDPQRVLADFLHEHASYLWKGAHAPASVYLRVNDAPSDRYTLSLPGSTCHRIAPGESGFDGLFLAGDWTDNGINVGCIEATVVSGMQCSRAITGHPQWIYGEGWDEPSQRPTSNGHASASAASG